MSKDFLAGSFGIISLVLAIWASVPYILSIVKGQTKPHQLTWLVFSIMNGIILLSQYLKGARASILLYSVWLVSSTVIFILSLSHGMRGTSRWDKLLFGLSILTIVAWVLTSNPAVAIWLTVFIDVFATLMMILKIRAYPDSEAISPWVIATAAYVFTILSLINKPLGILYVRPTYGLISEAAVLTAILIWGKGKPTKKTAPLLQ